MGILAAMSECDASPKAEQSTYYEAAIMRMNATICIPAECGQVMYVMHAYAC